jgi:antitoxin PrlF
MQAINDNQPSKELTATVTQRGQVTIPAEVMRILGAKPREKVTFQVKGKQVRLLPAAFTLESAYGSVTPRSHPEDFNAIIRSAKEEKAKQTI